MHPLYETLTAIVDGRFPPVDGVVEVHPPMHEGHWAIASFTGHALVLTDRSPDEVGTRAVDAFGGVEAPDFQRWLAGPHGHIGSLDVVLVGRGDGGGDLAVRTDAGDHPRVRRARHHRRDIRVHGDERGVVVLGRGLVDRLEMSVELTGDRSVGSGSGRELIAAGLGLVPAGDPVFAQVAPGNAASLRAFLACGFVPIGAEVLVRPQVTDGSDTSGAE